MAAAWQVVEAQRADVAKQQAKLAEQANNLQQQSRQVHNHDLDYGLPDSYVYAYWRRNLHEVSPTAVVTKDVSSMVWHMLLGINECCRVVAYSSLQCKQ